MKKINNKGFTLVELLAVIVVLLLITLVAIPSIASTFERNKNRINEQKIETIKSAGEIYASRYKKNLKEKEIYGEECTENKICNYYDKFLIGKCGISIQMILNADLITRDELKDSEGADSWEYTDNGNVIEIKPDSYDSIFVYCDPTGIYTLKNSGFKCQGNFDFD